MTQTNFNDATEWLLVHEGGYVNHPHDPGGATNKGVTQKTYDGYRKRIGSAPASVLNITPYEVRQIYRSQYWDRVMGDALPSGLDYAVYDFAVNSGPKRAVEFLQRRLGVSVDGQMGNQTLGAIQSADIEQLIIEYCTDRWNWMQRLRTWKTFGRGWTRRVMGESVGVQVTDTGVIDRAVKLSENLTPIAPTRAAGGKAIDSDEKATARFADGVNLNTIGTVAAGVAPTGVVAALQQEGPMQYALSGVVVIAAVMAAIVFYKKVIEH